MKSYIVFSDIHGDLRSFYPLKERIKDHDGAFFAGDGISTIEGITEKELYAVRGNCDYSGEIERVTEIDGVRILLTHGHAYKVKSDLLLLLYRARELNCRVAIFGHTHIPYIRQEDGVLLINPGACSGWGEKTHAILYLENGKASAIINNI